MGPKEHYPPLFQFPRWSSLSCVCLGRNVGRIKDIHGVGSNPRHMRRNCTRSGVIPNGEGIPRYIYYFEPRSNHDSNNVTRSTIKPERNVPHRRNGPETIFMLYSENNIASS